MDPKNDTPNAPQNPPKTENINIAEKLAKSAKRVGESRQKRALRDAHLSRVKGVAETRGSVPGGLQESAATMADPGYLERSRAATQVRSANAAKARQDSGVVSPHRGASDAALGAFRAASGGKDKVAVGTNPVIAARAERFNNKK